MSINKNNLIIKTILILSLLLIGGFHEFTSCILSIFFTFYLLLERKKENKNFQLNLNFTIILLFTIFICYLIATITAVDWGINLFGIIKFFPVIAFSIMVNDITIDEKKDVLLTISKFSVIITLISMFFISFDSSTTLFNVDGRLYGTFQYPNTFALLLLISIIILVDQFDIKLSKKKCFFDFIKIAILIYGIFASGSRTYLIMLMIYFTSLMFIKNRKKLSILLSSFFVICIIGIAICVFVGEYSSSVGRFLTFSLSSSSFVGRIIYYIDGIIQILTHPLGLGYRGYYYAQEIFKTAYYSVLTVHNDFLQMFLDAGWIAGLSLIAITIKAIFSKNTPILFKQIVIFIALGSCLDFHFQFISIFLIFILVLDYSGNKNTNENNLLIGIFDKIKIFIQFEKTISIKRWLKIIICSFIILINTYFLAILITDTFGLYDISLQLYPFNTNSKIELLNNSSTIEEANYIADDILNQNDKISVAYTAKSTYAYSLYDLEAAIEYKAKELELSKYEIDVYIELLDLLFESIEYYTQIGDLEKIEYYTNYILEIPYIIETVIDEVSFLSKYLEQQIELDLPQNYIDSINQLIE